MCIEIKTIMEKVMKENETNTQSRASSKGVKVLKTILNTVVNILIVVVLITSIVIAVMAISSKADGISTIFGYTIQPIQSDSMKGGSPDGYGGKDFEKGDLMIAKATGFDMNAEYNIGDIVTYRKADTDGSTMLIVHRIVDKVKDPTDQNCYQTWGDNRTLDTNPDQTAIGDYLLAGDIGAVYYSADYEGVIIKGLGSVLDYLKSQQGFFLVVLLPMILFFLYELIRVILNFSNYNKSKAEEEKQEAVKAALAQAQNNQGDEVIENFTPEQMEQFKQFMAMQKQQAEAADADTETKDT